MGSESRPRDWRSVFTDLAADGRLSRSERAALRELIESEVDTNAERDRLRALAFDVARERLSARDASAVLTWIEDVSALLDRKGTQHIEPTAPASEAWFSPGEGPLDCIRRHIQATRAALDVCVYTITDDRLVRSLESAARRGVRVRILGDDVKSGDLGSDIKRLAQTGAQVRVDRSPNHMHHKFAIFDAAALLTGSYNWTRSAERGNSENVLVTADPGVVAAYAAEFEQVWGSGTELIG